MGRYDRDVIKQLGKEAFDFLREVVKNGYFMVKLTVRIDPPPSLSFDQLFINLFWWVQKNRRFFSPKILFKAFLVGQNFHICLRLGLRGLTPPPLRSA